MNKRRGESNSSSFCLAAIVYNTKKPLPANKCDWFNGISVNKREVTMFAHNERTFSISARSICKHAHAHIYTPNDAHEKKFNLILSLNFISALMWRWQQQQKRWRHQNICSYLYLAIHFEMFFFFVVFFGYA